MYIFTMYCQQERVVKHIKLIVLIYLYFDINYVIFVLIAKSS